MPPAQYKPITDVDQATERLRKYCGYQERSIRQVRTKLYELGTDPAWIDTIVARLVDENMLNETRFAHAYARGKFNQNGWGRELIKQGLRHHGVVAQLITSALYDIDEKAYMEAIHKWKRKFMVGKKWSNSALQRHRLMLQLKAKGFETDLILHVLREPEE